MTRQRQSLPDKEFHRALAAARKDPRFNKDIRKFIKITTGVYKLKDYGMDKL